MAIIYGLLPVLEALRSGRRQIEKVLIAEGAQPSRLGELTNAAHEARVTIVRSKRTALDRLAEGANHQGILAVIAAAKYADADDLLETISGVPLLVILDGVEDPHNLGAIIRTAEAAGANGIFIPERHAVGLTDVVAKTSAGAIEHIPVARIGNVTNFVENLKSRNIWVVGVEADAKKQYTDWDYTLPCAIVLGSEGKGIRRLVKEHCDEIVSIPMRGKVNSLNVSVAAGVMLFEAVKQRSAQKVAP
ncbi:MAG TPA: 23S rRNA (guanosine(2251)-2'-O)-methyltransferase RlmB [Blastocatellia bacterium]|nr:23S rRNA (guanosine(2251)-2'-O)-methyltransferase RlmB [Blastocatellia bacterium]